MTSSLLEKLANCVTDKNICCAWRLYFSSVYALVQSRQIHLILVGLHVYQPCQASTATIIEHNTLFWCPRRVKEARRSSMGARSVASVGSHGTVNSGGSRITHSTFAGVGCKPLPPAYPAILPPPPDSPCTLLLLSAGSHGGTTNLGGSGNTHTTCTGMSKSFEYNVSPVTTTITAGNGFPFFGSCFNRYDLLCAPSLQVCGETELRVWTQHRTNVMSSAHKHDSKIYP